MISRAMKSGVAGRVAAVVVSLAAIALAAPVAMAQPGGGGGPGGRFMAPAVNSRSLDKYAAMLQMTDDQKEAARTLFDGYQEQAGREREKLQGKMDEVRQKFRESRDPTVWQSMGETMQKYREERKKADEAFFGDVKSILTAEQIEKWPQVERANRRETVLRRGIVSGERVNLFDVVDDLKLSEAALSQVKPILSDYDQELDKALVAREAVSEEGFTKFQQFRASGDVAAMQDFIEKGRTAATRVKEINKKYARAIADVLPEEKQGTFGDEVRKESYPEVYRTTQADRALEAAAGFADLTAEQKERIAALKATYAKAIGPVRDRMVSATEEMEQKFSAADMMNRFRGQQDGPLGDLRRERREVVEKTQEDLKKILTPEQAEKLPVGGDDGRGDGGGGDRPGRRARQRPDT